jgi:arginyl-tRNA synthetase
MRKDKFKKQFSESTAEAFQKVYPDIFKEVGPEQVFAPEFVHENIEKPKDPKMGRIALPVFRYGRLLKDKPPQIASLIATTANDLLSASADETLVTVSAAGGFLNAQVDFKALAGATVGAIVESEQGYHGAQPGAGKKLLVEYSSANIAKPFGIAHLRSTMIGHSLRRIFKCLGYDVTGINYLGDWGTQFGKMIVAWRLWGDEKKLDDSKNPLDALLDLYVKFHNEAENDDSLNEQARKAFKSLEDGDDDAVALWKKFGEISMRELDQIYGALGVEFDLTLRESDFNDKMDAIIDRLAAAGLTSISQGALVVDLGDPQLPPCLLKKSDGATLYATRELASLVYRWKEYKFDESLYVVGVAQVDHFKQALKVIELLEEAEKLPVEERMIGRVKQVDFGWVRFGQQTMSTRKGEIVFLEDVYQTATVKARELVAEKNPDLENIDDVALMIGVGAVVFAQLSVRRQKDVNLVWDDILSFEGETGPYLQYTHARLCSLLRKFPGEISSKIDAALLDREEEHRLVEHLADFPEAVADAARMYDPQLIAGYLIRLAAAFNRFYQRKDDSGRIDKIISDDANLTGARMALVRAVQLVLKDGLYLLGLKAPEAM